MSRHIYVTDIYMSVTQNTLIEIYVYFYYTQQ